MGRIDVESRNTLLETTFRRQLDSRSPSSLSFPPHRPQTDLQITVKESDMVPEGVKRAGQSCAQLNNYSCPVTFSLLPTTVYLSLRISDALRRSPDFLAACSLLQALWTQFFCGSPLSTRNAMFRDLKEASNILFHVCFDLQLLS